MSVPCCAAIPELPLIMHGVNGELKFIAYVQLFLTEHPDDETKSGVTFGKVKLETKLLVKVTLVSTKITGT